MIAIKSLHNIDDISKYYPLIKELYPSLQKQDFTLMLQEMIEKQSYHLLVAEINNQTAGILGYTVSTLFYIGKFMQISNLIVDNKYRNLGVASNLITYAKKVASSLECSQIVLESYVDNKASHKIYQREDFHIKAHHFMHKLC